MRERAGERGRETVVPGPVSPLRPQPVCRSFVFRGHLMVMLLDSLPPFSHRCRRARGLSLRVRGRRRSRSSRTRRPADDEVDPSPDAHLPSSEATPLTPLSLPLSLSGVFPRGVRRRQQCVRCPRHCRSPGRSSCGTRGSSPPPHPDTRRHRQRLLLGFYEHSGSLMGQCQCWRWSQRRPG